MVTSLYIDGFNLYYRALKDTPFRWLDLRKLAETLFPQDVIRRVCYFTARLDARPGNPSIPTAAGPPSRTCRPSNGLAASQPRTWLQATPAGRRAFEEYLSNLRRALNLPAGATPAGRSVPGADVQAVGFRDWCQEHSGVSEHVLAVLYRTTVYLAVW